MEVWIESTEEFELEFFFFRRNQLIQGCEIISFFRFFKLPLVTLKHLEYQDWYPHGLINVRIFHIRVLVLPKWIDELWDQSIGLGVYFLTSKRILASVWILQPTYNLVLLVIPREREIYAWHFLAQFFWYLNKWQRSLKAS